MSDDEKYAELGRVIRDLTDALAAEKERADRAERERDERMSKGFFEAEWLPQLSSAQARAAEMERGMQEVLGDLRVAVDPTLHAPTRESISRWLELRVNALLFPSARPAAEDAEGQGAARRDGGREGR